MTPTKVLSADQEVAHVLPQRMVVIEQCMCCTYHQTSNTTPVPTTGPGTKVQADTVIKLLTHVEAQEARIIRMDQDAPLCQS